MNPRAIAIVGIGLMGASLAAKCRRTFPGAHIIGISRNRKALALARKRLWIHASTSDLQRGVQSADLIVLCTPVNTLSKYLKALDHMVASGTLVTDVGSVKGSVLREVEKKKFKKIHFVGAHPMVGGHQRGAEAAHSNLYDEGFTFLIRSPKTDPKSYASVKAFWKKVMPRVVEISAQAHDRVVSDISHLPHVVAMTLVLAVNQKSLKFAAGGFRDTTRIAQAHPSIWLPIYQANRKALGRSLGLFEAEIRKFRKALKSKNHQALSRIVAQAALRRRQI